MNTIPREASCEPSERQPTDIPPPTTRASATRPSTMRWPPSKQTFISIFIWRTTFYFLAPLPWIEHVQRSQLRNDLRMFGDTNLRLRSDCVGDGLSLA